MSDHADFVFAEKKKKLGGQQKTKLFDYIKREVLTLD